MNKLLLTLTLLIAAIQFDTSVQAATNQGAVPYKSLEEFCLKTGADTAANCKCGGKKAKKIASPKERQLLLTMMAGSAQARQQAMMSMKPAQMNALMAKMDKIGKGCGN